MKNEYKKVISGELGITSSQYFADKTEQTDVDLYTASYVARSEAVQRYDFAQASKIKQAETVFKTHLASGARLREACEVMQFLIDYVKPESGVIS